MTTNPKLLKMAQILNDAPPYPFPSSLYVLVGKNKFLKEGLDEYDSLFALTYFQKNKIITNVVGIKKFGRRLMVLKIDKSKLSEYLTPDENLIKQGDLKFDNDKGVIYYGEKSCKLPLGKIEYHFVKVLFSQPLGSVVTETDILDSFDSELCKADSEKAVYDAMRRVNQKIRKHLGIDELIKYEGSNFWIKI